MEQLVKKINSGDKLASGEASLFFEGMLTGKLTESQIGSTLTSMKFRGETIDELAALVTVMDRHKIKFPHNADPTVDTCGTGGDGKSTVNISTAVSVILAAMGHRVVKHGNSAQSGTVGSADILKVLGFDLDYKAVAPLEFFNRHNYVFMMAPHYHPALKTIGKVRREIKVPTIFNFAGPLVNPANPTYQIIGISDRKRLVFLANVILKSGKNHITVYSSFDGYDEVSSKDKTECITIANGTLDNFIIDPSDYFDPFDMPVVRNSDEALDLFVKGISGEDEKIMDLFALNTALALKTMKACSMIKSFNKARECILSGDASRKLESITSREVKKNVS